MISEGPLYLLSSCPVRGALQHPDFSFVLRGETAENHDNDVFEVNGSLYIFQLHYHLVYAQQKRSWMAAKFYFHGVEIDGKVLPLLGDRWHGSAEQISTTPCRVTPLLQRCQTTRLYTS